MKSSGRSEYQDYLVGIVHQHEGMAAEFVASHLLQRIEIGDFLTHDRAYAGNLSDALEL